jgi:hypothetical protein
MPGFLGRLCGVGGGKAGERVGFAVTMAKAAPEGECLLA